MRRDVIGSAAAPRESVGQEPGPSAKRGACEGVGRRAEQRVAAGHGAIGIPRGMVRRRDRHKHQCEQRERPRRAGSVEVDEHHRHQQAQQHRVVNEQADELPVGRAISAGSCRIVHDAVRRADWRRPKQFGVRQHDERGAHERLRRSRSAARSARRNRGSGRAAAASRGRARCRGRGWRGRTAGSATASTRPTCRAACDRRRR